MLSFLSPDVVVLAVSVADLSVEELFRWTSNVTSSNDGTRPLFTLSVWFPRLARWSARIETCFIF